MINDCCSTAINQEKKRQQQRHANDVAACGVVVIESPF